VGSIMKKLLTGVVGSLVLLTACGESGAKVAGVVQAAGKSLGESMQSLGADISELAATAPEEARARTQALLDEAAAQMKEVEDSETVQRISEELGAFVDKLGTLRQSIATKVNVAQLQQTVEDLIQRFKDDPRVASALKSLQEKLSAFSR
jgi:polyhydroxyalkanoate synthesis regulator phasin